MSTRTAAPLAIGVLVCIGAVATADATYAAWTQHRDALLKDPTLIRYYTVEKGTGDAGDLIPNLTADDAPLTRVMAKQPDEPLQRIEGRWPEKQAVRLDRAFLAAPAFDVTGREFTVEAWVRVNGPGGVPGDTPTQTGTLLSQGNGYWDGWRVTMSYPGRPTMFEMGRPAPVNSFGIRTPPVPDRVWHHLVALWDGTQTRIYLDGMRLAQGAYPGDYTPPKPGAQFRLGFADAGWGSCVLDVDEVAIYKRALSPTDILREAYVGAPLSDALAERFAKANEALDGGDSAAAAAEFAALTKAADLAPEFVALARVRLGQALLAQQKTAEALAALTPVMDAQGVPEGLRSLALAPLRQLAIATSDAPASLYEALLAKAAEMSPREVANLRLNLARKYARDGKRAEAEQQFQEVLSMADLPPREKLEVLLQAGHTAAQAGDFDGARKQYAAVMGVAEAPPQFRSLAQLCIARSYVQQKEWAKATSAYGLVKDLEGVPPSHVWEADECVLEIARLKAGQPARDPAWSRVQLPKRPKPGVELFVAPNGSDANAGTKERPLATLLGARGAIRALKAAGLPDGGVTVTVRAGDYQAAETLALEAQDSGTEQSPIIYRAEKAGSVTFTGGTKIEGFAPVTDPAILARLPEEARGKVMQVDLPAQGITDLGQIQPVGMSRPGHPVVELYFDGKPMAPARWPDEGFVKTGKVLDPKSTFEYDGDRPSRWGQAKDLWIYGYFRWLWADDSLPVASIDGQTRQLKTGLPPGYNEIVQGAPYYVFNLLEEIDQPGEWYLDRESGLLYFLPPSDPARADVRLSMLNVPFVTMADVSWVTIEGLTFDLGRSDGVIIKGGEHCLLEGCTIRQIGGTAITIDGGTNHGVLSCELGILGRNGTSVKGGDRKTLTPGGHLVENCRIHDFSRLWRTYTPAFWTDGVGNRFAHNLVYNSPGHAMRVEGDEHLIEFNEVHHVCMETDDQGGIDMWGNPTYRGVVIRYNYWHDIGSEHGLGQAGIRLDDAISRVLIYGNVFCRASRNLFGGVQIHGGKENWVENNIFADCLHGISFSGWGPERWKQFLDSAGVAKQIEDMAIAEPPRSTHYPDLAHLVENEGANWVWSNVAYNCGDFLTRDRGIQDLMDNTVTMQNPGFVDAAKGDFTLKPDSPLVQGNAFRAIPFGEIGPYGDGR
jgi:tetratricopeptide (TPR) repeat protein